MAGPTSSIVYVGWTPEAAAANTNIGIVVGTGTTQMSPDDYALEAQIAEGTGTDQLNYGACTVGAVTVDGNISTVSVSRSFTNNSGADITISEVGLIVQPRYGTGYILITRDVLTTPQVIAAGDTQPITLKIRATA
jgi:hypothetical protein